jgi:hypothetical protein
MPSSHEFRAAAAQAKLESARAETIRAQAEAERARAESEKVRAEADRARMAEERATRMAAEESARKTKEAEARISKDKAEQDARLAADKRRVDTEHLAGSIVGGMAVGKLNAHYGKKAAEKKAAKIAPEAKALAKEAKKALAGTGKANHTILKGIADTAPPKRGPLGLGSAAVFLGDAALGYAQASKLRAEGDEETARDIETAARGSMIAGASSPLLRWDAERTSAKAIDLKSQALLRSAELAAEGPAGPEPKKPRAKRPALAKVAERQKTVVAPEAAPALQGEPAKALPAPAEASKVEAAAAKVAGPTKAELQAAAKQAFQEHPNPAQLRKAMGPFYKYDKNALAAVMRENKIKVPGFGLKYALPITAGAAAISSLIGSSGEAEAKPLTERLSNAAADAGTALKGLVPTNAREAVELTAQFAFPAVGTGLVAGVEAARSSQGVHDMYRAAKAGDVKAFGRAYHDTSMDIAKQGHDAAMAVYSGANQAAHYVAGARGNRARYAQQAAERHAAGYGTAPSAHSPVSQYITHRGGRVTTAHFRPETLAARSQNGPRK